MASELQGWFHLSAVHRHSNAHTQLCTHCQHPALHGAGSVWRVKHLENTLWSLGVLPWDGFYKNDGTGGDWRPLSALTVGSRAVKQGKGEQESIQIPVCCGQETTVLPKTGQVFVSNNLMNFSLF